MKAVILNSGMGKRMGKYTSEHPKCMTQIAENGETILSRQLKMLKKYGINQIVITTGLFREVLENYCRDLNLGLELTFVHNEIYDKTNYIYSIYLAKDYIQDDILLMHGDLVFSEEVLSAVLEYSSNCMTVSTTKVLPEKDFKAVISTDENGYKMVDKVGIEFFDSANAAQPLYKIRKEQWMLWLNKIAEFCENGNRKCYAENALNELNGKCRIAALDVGDGLCEEIDNPKDYKRVCGLLRKEEVGKN